MDPRIAWYEPQQLGIAHYHWIRMYNRMTSLNNLNAKSHFTQNARTDYISFNALKNDRKHAVSSKPNSVYNEIQQKRKRDNNLASTYGLNHPSLMHLISEDLMTPWLRETKYEPGILG